MQLARAATLVVAARSTWYVAVDAVGRIDERSVADARLGGMWAVIATVVVITSGAGTALRAGSDRLIATSVSMIACLLYLLLFAFHPLGLAVVVGASVAITSGLGYAQAATTAAITTTVVLVVASLGPNGSAWQTPLLRTLDTIVGIAFGLCASWLLDRSVSDRYA